MKKKFLIAIIILGGFVGFDIFLNFTLYNPSFITPPYGYAVSHNLVGSETFGYPLTSIKTINTGRFPEPRASVIGVVQDVVKSADGDIHVNIKSPDGVIVTEIIPEYPLPALTVGKKVKIWGVTRYDISHRWWELHPVIGWEEIAD